MADDIEDLRARVAAAKDRLSDDASFARKVELRLDDLVRIVEGSLARQGAELEQAQARIGDLEADLERALARAEQAIGEAQRAERLARENGELRQMVMALLEVIEGRQKSSLASVMQRLEENVSALMVPAAAATAATEVEPAPEAALDIAIAGSDDEPAAMVEAITTTIIEDDLEAGEADEEAPRPMSDIAPPGEAPPIEDLNEIALYDAADEVIEPKRG
jgi:hypothetical protein